MSKFKNVIPMSIPRIGGDSQQPEFDITQIVYSQCECGVERFCEVFKVGIISRLAPGNKTNQDISVKAPAGFVCCECGKELNPLKKEKVEDGNTKGE